MGTKLLCPWCQRFNYITGVGPHFCRGCSHRTDVEKGMCDCLMCDPAVADLSALPEIPFAPLPEIPPSEVPPFESFLAVAEQFAASIGKPPSDQAETVAPDGSCDDSSEDNRVLEEVTLSNSELRINYGLEVCGRMLALPNVIVTVQPNGVSVRIDNTEDASWWLELDITGERLAKWVRVMGMAEDADDARADFE